MADESGALQKPDKVRSLEAEPETETKPVSKPKEKKEESGAIVKTPSSRGL